jgi:hypothetical protein
MPQPTGRDLYIDKLLSNVSLGYSLIPGDFVADQIFPIVNVPQQSGKIGKYNKGDWFRDEAEKRAPGVESSGGGYKHEDPAEFFCDEWAFHKDIVDEDIDNADDVFDAEEDATSYVTDKIRISRERRFSSSFFGTGLYTTDLSGVTITPGSDEFKCWDESGSTPIEDIDGAKLIMRLLIGRVPNVLVVSERVHFTLKNHSEILDRYKYTTSENITKGILANVFEVDKYLVAASVYAPNAEGIATADTLAYSLNQYGALLAFVEPSPSKRRPSMGYTLRWNRPANRGISGDRYKSTIRRFRNNEKGYTRIEGSSYEKMILLAPDAGIFFNNAIANGRTLS